jgi:phosphatidate phosphatase APP1
MIGRFSTRFILALALLGSSLAAAADRAPLVISDVDDTVKLANVPHKFPAAVVNGLFGEKIFGGMAVLYGIMAREKDSMIFLSGGPTLLKHHVTEELDEGNFPDYRLMLRNVFKKGNDVPTHKRARLEELLVANPENPFILIGDDGEKDPEILSGFSTAHPGKAPVVYIHRVLARAIPAGITSYNTAFEIALYEVKAGRMTVGEAAEVGKAVLEAKAKLVFPKFAECPKSIAYPTSSEIESSAILQDLIQKNQARWSAYCAARG